MGTVYRATDLVLSRPVAVKLLPPALAAQDPTHVRRFSREAHAAASIAHPAVVRIYDAGVEDDTRFIVMEYVPGENLATLVARESPLDPVRAVTIAAQVAAALSAAHRAGIVHRDIKPANVMIDDEGKVKVLDFGVARLQDATTLTQVSSVPGTAAYMAPEQALGERADARSDIYALGCLLYALLCGRPPFSGDNAAAILHQQIDATPAAPRELDRRIPPALDALVLRMLAKSRGDRPQSAGQVHDELSELSSTMDRPSEPIASTPVPTTRVMPRASARHGAARRRMVVLTATAVAVAALAISAIAGSDGATRATSRHLVTAPPAAPPPPRPTSSAPTAPPANPQQPPDKQAPDEQAPVIQNVPPGPGGMPPGQAKKLARLFGGGEKHPGQWLKALRDHGRGARGD